MNEIKFLTRKILRVISQSPCILGALHGDIKRQPSIRTKYGFLFQALAQRFPLRQVCDISLHGIARYLNALRVWHPRREDWQSRYYKNPSAFIQRSKRFAADLRALRDSVDVVLQVGVMFDAAWENSDVPNVIYTDYTAMLAERKPGLGPAPFGPRQRAEWIRLERQAMERAAHICTRSRYVRDAIIADYGIAPDRVTVVGGGVNLPTLPTLTEGSAEDYPTALFIGADFYRKGGDLVLQAFALVRKKIPNARMLFLTADHIPADLPLEGVQVIAAKWDRQAIDALYRRADVFVLPSRLETWGDVFLEAMAYGLPCIGVRGEAMSEIIVDAATGVVVPPGDVQALANAMTRLLSDSALRKHLGQSARRRVESTFTWSQVVAGMTPVIEGVVERKFRSV